MDVSAEVLGQGRMGVKITSLIAYLRTVMRLPLRQIQAYLATLHGLKISVGEIATLLHRLDLEDGANAGGAQSNHPSQPGDTSR